MSAQVFWVGSAAILIEVVAVLAVFVRHPKAPISAIAAGFGLAVGYLFVHFTPRRDRLSDSFMSGHASPVSVFAAGFETLAAVVLGIAGLRSLRNSGLAASATFHAPIPLAQGLTHPVVAALAIGNAAILVGSLMSRG